MNNVQCPYWGAAMGKGSEEVKQRYRKSSVVGRNWVTALKHV